jgi:muramoyltetrapeptide carboxypeptidase LdcA involved in peptidoglycan recycling
MIIPEKLKPGDEIRVVAPSKSLGIVPEEVRRSAEENLVKMGFKVSFGSHVLEMDDFASPSIEARVEDLHEACVNPAVKCILTSIGGYNVNQLLRYLDYKDFYTKPKILCGFSDITALSNAIYAKTGLVTYSGPHFSSFGMKRGLEYTLAYFRKCLLEDVPFSVEPCPYWSDDPWYHNQDQRKFVKNNGPYSIYEGEASGTLLGGNLCTLNLLQGSEFMPDLAGSLLLIEDDNESNAVTFDRDLQSLIHQPGFAGVKGLLVGRFQKESEIDRETLVKIIKSKRELSSLPVAADLDFGHTTPIFTFPVGGQGQLSLKDGKVEFIVLEH